MVPEEWMFIQMVPATTMGGMEPGLGLECTGDLDMLRMYIHLF